MRCARRRHAAARRPGAAPGARGRHAPRAPRDRDDEAAAEAGCRRAAAERAGRAAGAHAGAGGMAVGVDAVVAGEADRRAAAMIGRLPERIPP